MSQKKMLRHKKSGKLGVLTRRETCAVNLIQVTAWKISNSACKKKKLGFYQLTLTDPS